MSQEQMLEAIRRFFSDTSRSRDETRTGLLEAAAEIQGMVAALDDDDATGGASHG